MNMDPAHLFKMKQPCKDCPFLKDSPIKLSKGRMDEIIESLHNDHPFTCHKTINYGGDDQWNDKGEFNTLPQNAYCAGSMIYMEKAGRRALHMRLGMEWNFYDPKQLRGHERVIDPDDN
jgi:hypothetical protein